MAPHEKTPAEESPPGAHAIEDECSGAAVDLTNIEVRIASVFVLLVTSLLGAFLPIILAKHAKTPLLDKIFFFFVSAGTGVILATAWMHLLPPAAEALHSNCLANTLGGYDWAMAIGLLTILAMFLVEIIAASYGARDAHPDGDHQASPEDLPMTIVTNVGGDGSSEMTRQRRGSDSEATLDGGEISRQPSRSVSETAKLKDNAGKETETRYLSVSESPGGTTSTIQVREILEPKHSLKGHLATTFILEFGVLLHGVFIGLVVATTEQPVLLCIVFAFHQFFEGLGLGSRLASTPWPEHGRWWPHIFSLLYSLSSPLAAGIALLAKPQQNATQLLVTGIFNAISAGILLYTGLVELLAREFLMDPKMSKAPLGVKLSGFGCIAFGASMMAVLARWA